MQKLNDLSRSLTALKPDGTGRRIERVAVAFEAGRDGFWLARWLKARGIEAYLEGNQPCLNLLGS